MDVFTPEDCAKAGYVSLLNEVMDGIHDVSQEFCVKFSNSF